MINCNSSNAKSTFIKKLCYFKLGVISRKVNYKKSRSFDRIQSKLLNMKMCNLIVHISLYRIMEQFQKIHLKIYNREPQFHNFYTKPIQEELIFKFCHLFLIIFRNKILPVQFQFMFIPFAKYPVNTLVHPIKLIL